MILMTPTTVSTNHWMIATKYVPAHMPHRERLMDYASNSTPRQKTKGKTELK